MIKARHGLRAYRSAAPAAEHTEHPRHSKCVVHSPPSPCSRHLAPHVSLSLHQQSPCQSSCGKARVRVVRLMANTEDASMRCIWAMRNWSEFLSGEDRSRVQSAKRDSLDFVQLVAKRRLAGRSKPRPMPVQRRPTRHSGLAGPSTNTPEWAPSRNGFQKTCNADLLLAQETHLPKDALVAEESWMRSQGRRACAHGEWVSNKQTACSKGRAGVVVAVALRHGLATPHGAGASSCARGACLRSSTVALHPVEH